MYKVLIWGIGAAYNRHVNVLKYLELLGQIEIIGLTATEIPDTETIDGFNVVCKDELLKLCFDFLIVMSDKQFWEIVHTAIQYGVKMEQIVPCRVLDIPGINFCDYADLKRSNLSVISNNCWGGIIYHTLGLECCSPFKNLFLEDGDYIKLLKKFEYYMHCELRFVRFEIDIHSKLKYPVMALDDILVHCNHDSGPEEAYEKWNCRVQKLNLDNLFVEMYTENKEIMQQFLAIEKYSKRICFVPFKSEDKKVIQLNLNPGQTEFWETVNSNAGVGKNSLSYRIIDLLNMKIDSCGRSS